MTYAPALARFTDRQKKAAGVFLVLIVVAFANEGFDWRLVGNYDWEAIVALTLVGLSGLVYMLLSRRRR